MFKSENIDSRPIEANTHTFSKKACSTKCAVITTLVLVALGSMVIGCLALGGQNIFGQTHFFSTFPPLATGLLLGGGGVLVIGLILYGISQKFCKSAPPPVVIENQEPPPLEAPIENPQPPKDPLVPKEEAQQERVQVPRNSLRPAMRLFKNFNSILATKFEKEGNLENKERLNHHVSAVEQKIYEIEFLRKVLLDYPEWKGDADFRGWVASSLMCLQKGLARIQNTDKELKKAWESALAFLNITEKEWLALPPLSESIPPYAPLSLLKIERVQRTPTLIYPGVNEIKPESSSEVQKTTLNAPESYPTFEKKEDLILVQAWHTYLLSQYKENELKPDPLETEAAQFLLHLPRASTLPQFLKSLSESEKGELVEQLYAIANLTLTLHVISGRGVLHPSRFLALLKSLDFLLTVTQQIEQASFSGYTMWTTHFHTALTDSYFDLGPYQNEIFQTLHDIEEKGEGISLVHLTDKSSKTLLHQWHSKGEGNQPIEDPYLKDFEGKCIPRSVVCLRSLALLAQGFSLPHHLLSYGTKPYGSRREYKGYMEGLQQRLQSDAKEVLQKRELLTIDENKQILPLNIQFKEWHGIGTSDPLLENLGTPMSPYYALSGPIKNDEIRMRLAAGIVSNVTCFHTDQNGNFGGSSGKEGDTQSMDGLQQMQITIHQDKFIFPDSSIEESRDLQKMASGQANRASNALYTFRRYPHLFLHEKHGEDYKRTFRLLVFRKDLLMSELTQNPTAVDQVLSNFDEMFSLFEKLGEFKTWTFLYKAHSDLLSSLRSSSIERVEREKMHTLYTKKLESWISEAEKGEPRYFASRSALHLAYLYDKAVLGFKNEEVLPLAKSLLVAKTQIEHMLLASPMEGQPLFDLSRKVMPQLIGLIEKEGTEVLDEMLAYRLKGEKRKWETSAKGVYTSGQLVVDLNTFQITQGSKMEGPLPQEIRENISLKALFGETLLKEIYTFTYVTTPLGKAWHVALAKDGTAYSLYLRSGDPNFPLLFRKKEGQEWEQWIRIQEASSTLPLDFTTGFLWSGDAAATIEDPAGKKLYSPHFEGNSLTSLERHVNGHKETLLDMKDHALFARLDEPEAFVVTETPAKQAIVTYLRGNAQYQWNAETLKWESTLYKGYFLSKKGIEEWVPVGTQGSEKKAKFFASTFKHFHLLKNKEGKGKLIIPHRAFQRMALQKTALDDEMKYSPALVPVRATSSPWEKQTFAVFDLEVDGHLKSKRPQDFLYLSYLLFVQGKYGEAMLYLQKSQAVWTAVDQGIAAFRQQVMEWFLQWEDKSPNASAFKTKMLKMEHQLRESTFASLETMLQYDALYLPSLMEQRENYLKNEAKVDPHLRLSQEEKQDLERLTSRATNSGAKALTESLDKEIEFLEKNLPLVQSQEANAPTKYIPVPLFDVSKWLTPVKESETHQNTNVKVETLVNELQNLFKGETLADAIGNELAEDIERHAAKVAESYMLAENVSLHELLDDVLIKREEGLLQKERQLRARILHQFLPLNLSKTKEIFRELQEQEALYDSLFEKARHGFGIGDLSSLIEMGAIGSNQVDALMRLIRDFETARTDRRLVARKRESVQKVLSDPKNSILREECAAMLQEWRQYDPESHPYAPALLLLEDELNITARHSQIKHIHKLIAHPDSFIHEAMAGGKTTFLRNVFSAIERQKGRLPGVLTYAPLMAMHHKEYAGVNNLALGSTAYPIYYERNAPHDETALKLMTIYHLKALSRNGRIDQTPQAAISLGHTLTEYVRVLDKGNQKLVNELTPPVNAMQKLLSIRSKDLSTYGDELDGVFNPMKDFNYAVGGGKKLERQYYEPALTLVQLMMEVKPLQEMITALKKNHLYLQQLGEVEFENLLRSIAKAAFDHLKLPFDEEKTLDYLTEIHQKNSEEQQKMVAFYEKVILAHTEPDVVLQMQLLHVFIGTLFRDMKKKVVGTDFGRSEKDGISVKPFSFSAVCQENSQRNFPLATVLEICIDYLVSGVGIEGARSYVTKIKTQATQQLKEAENLETTPAALEFEKRFDKKLPKVKEGDYAQIATQLESSFELFKESLCEILLKNFTYYEDKIEGNAHHLPHRMGHISGSSGSPERVKTLPGSIQKHQKLIRQSGAIGSVFYALLKEFDDKRDMIKLSLSKPIEMQLAEHLQPGDTFVDNAPFFPGKKGMEIVQSVSSAAPNLSSFRFLDEENDLCIWNKEQIQKGEEGVKLDEVVSAISHKGRQGTNWTFAKGKKGIVEAGVSTELTSFYQSLMRLRLLGKGQRGQVLYDETLEEIWSKVPELEGKSLLAKTIWSLVQNESTLLKNLHFQANKKEIHALRTRAIDEIQQSVTDIPALLSIKELSKFELVKKSPLDPMQCGRPILLENSNKILEEIVKLEKEKLIDLKKEIGELKINPTFIQTCNAIIDRQVKALESTTLIMESRDLPDRVPANSMNHESVEEIEVQSQVQGEVAQEVDQMVSLEVEMELTLEQEAHAEMESTIGRRHPASDEGREDLQQHMPARYALPHGAKKPFNGELGDAGGGFVDPNFFPGVVTTNFALGIYHGGHNATIAQQQEARNKKLWLYDEPKFESCISPKTLIGISSAGEIYCVLGSVKDSDLYFNAPLKEKRIADEWIDLPLEEAKTRELSQFCKRQREAISYDLENTGHYEGLAKYYLPLKKVHYFKFDLHETQIPSSVPIENHKQWVQTTALAKLLYVDAPLSEQECEFLMQWLDKPPIPLNVLEKRLATYLEKFSSNPEKNQLLALIKRKRLSVQKK